MRKYNQVLGIVFLAIVCLFSACKKVTHEISEEIVSINESTVSRIQIGKKLKVGFITNNVNSFEFSIVKEDKVLLSQNIKLEPNHKIVTEEYDIPLDQSWVGNAVLKVKYGQNVEKTKAIIFEESNPVMFMVGGSLGSGWEPTLATPMSLYEEGSKSKFESFEYIAATGGGFKFIPTNIDWTDAFGKGATPGTLLQGENVDNLEVTQDDFYRIRMDAVGLTYEVLKVKMGLIGDATPGGWDKDTDMTLVGAKGSYLWKATLNLVPGNLKFRANNDWAINFGGTVDNITLDGPDIAIAAAGTYTVELDLTPGAYKAVIQKQ